MIEDLLPFGVLRIHLTATGGTSACVTFEQSGVQVSWRSGSPGVPGDAWSSELPGELQTDAVFLVAAVGPDASFSMRVTEDQTCPTDEAEPTETCDIDLCGPSGFYVEDFEM